MSLNRDPELIVMEWARGAPLNSIYSMISRLYKVAAERKDQDDEAQAEHIKSILKPGDYVGRPYKFRTKGGPSLDKVRRLGHVIRVNKKTITVREHSYYYSRRKLLLKPEMLVPVELEHPITQEEHEERMKKGRLD